MKGLFIPGITAEMFRNGCLESIEALMAEGEIYDIDYSPSKTGKWINRRYAGERSVDTVICTECGEEFSFDAETGVSAEDYNFCPNCGEKKKEQKNEEVRIPEENGGKEHGTT